MGPLLQLVGLSLGTGPDLEMVRGDFHSFQALRIYSTLKKEFCLKNFVTSVYIIESEILSDTLSTPAPFFVCDWFTCEVTFGCSPCVSSKTSKSRDI